MVILLETLENDFILFLFLVRVSLLIKSFEFESGSSLIKCL